MEESPACVHQEATRRGSPPSIADTICQGGTSRREGFETSTTPLESLTFEGVLPGEDFAESARQSLHFRRTAAIYDFRLRSIGHDAGVFERLEDFDDIGFVQFQGEKMLAHQNVVIFDAAERVAIVFTRVLRAAGTRPRGCENLHHHSVPLVIPREHSFGMTLGPSLRIYRISIELVIPYNIGKMTVIYFVESRPHRVRRGIAHTTSALLQFAIGIACVGESLAEMRVRLNRAAEGADSLGTVSTTGKGLRIEFENEPPVHGLAGFQQGRRSG